MKSTIALLALMSILTFGIPANVLAALTASTGVSLDPYNVTGPYFDLAPTQHLNVTTSPTVFLSARISDDTGIGFVWNSMTVDISKNNVPVSHETYFTYDIGGIWNRFGVYDTSTYMAGLMSQGAILVGFGSRDTFSPYATSLSPGDVWKADISYDVQDQGIVHSIATVTYVPEPTSLLLVGVSALCFLRRKRV